ncbi:MAG: metallophosphoesterase family protein [Gemmatimonadales bacterium]
MRLGIISDTHGVLPNEVLDVFREVDHILHAGDVGPLEILTDLESLAPVTAVYGNVDDFDIRDRCEKVANLMLDGFIIVVTHGDQFGSPSPGLLHEAFPDAEIIVYGHTHRPRLELVDKTVTVMNPGSAGNPRDGVAASVGIMELEPGIPPRARLVPLV